MSSGGQRPELAGHGDDAAAVFVATFPMPAGTRFDWHTHEDHQLAWAASGVLTVLARGEPVSRVAGRVGYDTASAFVAAFRRETGQTPGSFFRA